MLIRILIIGVFLAGGCSCAYSPPNVQPPSSVVTTPKPYEFDRDKARVISDSMVDALIKNDRPALFSKMEKGAKDYYDQASFDDVIDKMLGMFGSPIDAKFKKVEQGRKSGIVGGYDKPMLKYWYAVRTSKYDFGNHFISVEIVPDEDDYGSSGVAIVNFPMGVPEDMK